MFGLFFQTITPGAERRGENGAQQRRQGGPRRSGRRLKGISDIMVISLLYVTGDAYAQSVCVTHVFCFTIFLSPLREVVDEVSNPHTHAR